MVFCPAARGLWWMLSLRCPSPRMKSQCMRWSAPSQPVRSRRKESRSRCASKCRPSRLSFKVTAILLFPEELPALGGLPSFNSLPLCPGRLLANLSYTLQLDGHRTRRRGLFSGGSHELSGNTSVTPAKSCMDFRFHFPVRELMLVFWEGLTEVRSNEGTGLALSPYSCDR